MLVEELVTNHQVSSGGFATGIEEYRKVVCFIDVYATLHYKDTVKRNLKERSIPHGEWMETARDRRNKMAKNDT